MTIARITLFASLAACSTNAQPPAASSEKPVAVEKTGSLVERGRYIVSFAGCHDCHTPMKMTPNGPAPDMDRALSGHPSDMQMPPAPVLPAGPWMTTVSATMTAWNGPWGTSFTANLTPDKETGLGTWTTQNFVDTIRNARHMGAGRPLLPPMPAQVYAQMTTEDLEAVFAYLQTIPAVSNRVPAPIAPPVAQK
jgi:hypothetical protein